MSFLGKILSSPVRIINAPIKGINSAIDYTLGGDGSKESREDSCYIENVLDCAADAIEEAEHKI